MRTKEKTIKEDALWPVPVIAFECTLFDHFRVKIFAVDEETARHTALAQELEIAERVFSYYEKKTQSLDLSSQHVQSGERMN